MTINAPFSYSNVFSFIESKILALDGNMNSLRNHFNLAFLQYGHLENGRSSCTSRS